jgi:arabinose-5-phosphate isomerase
VNSVKSAVPIKTGGAAVVDIVEMGREVFDIEIAALQAARDALNDDFTHIVAAVCECGGKVIITGMGKPGHIGAKIAATLSSLGTSSFFLHPAEALHGDLGMVSKGDVVLAISNSGESEEIIRLLPNIKTIGATLIALTCNTDSALARYADLVYIFPKTTEACALNLAPTSSTTMMLAFGDALAVTLARLYGFTEEHYALFHPAGSLGKKLLVKVGELMHVGEGNAVVRAGTSLIATIVEMSAKGLSIVSIVDGENRLLGVLTDGDLRRLLERGVEVYGKQAEEVMTARPYTTHPETLAVEALQFLTVKNIAALPVVDEWNCVVGTIRMHDITRAGILL